jgi:GcrA cell cycle regulator
MEWTKEATDKLRVLWAENLSTAEIARRLKLSKNSVVGKAHRLNLPARPNPIRRTFDASGQVVRKSPAPLRGHQKQAASAVLGKIPRNISEPVVKQRWQKKPCCWPIGEPGKAGFHFCDVIAELGKPYCPDHAAIAYVRRRVAAE